MKSIKTLLAILLPTTIMLGAPIAQAAEGDNSCAVISTKKVPLNRDKHELFLTSHNGKRLSPLTELRHFSSPANIPSNSYYGRPSAATPGTGGSVVYRYHEKLKLAPGIHHFSGYAGKKYTGRYIPTIGPQVGGSGGKEFTFTINVEAGKLYNLIAQRTYPRTNNLAKKFQPVILSSQAVDCDQSKATKLYTAIKPDPEVINSAALPQQLSEEFNQLMLEINEYYQQSQPQRDNIAISRNATRDYVFGISGTLAKSGGLEITVVDKTSTAAALGLEKGDVIVSINSKPINADTLKVLSNEIGNTLPGDELTFVLLRQGKQVTLTKQYQPATLPGFQIYMDLASAR
ncbi:MAG: PDZ domain-containing protein [Algicola sp.]|nr:PDZ domain-containing protein [Algicola sp.]